MKTNEERFFILEGMIKKRVPGFKIKFKDEDTFMKILSKILFFNKAFATSYTTTIGKTVYFASKEKFNKNPGRYFEVLCHEYVHIMDYVKNPFLFILKYLFPQILVLLALGTFLAFVHPAYSLFLLALSFFAPWPAPGRTSVELRGYGVSIKVRQWLGHSVTVDRYIGYFTSSAYYFMCWGLFKGYVKKKLQKYIDSDDCVNDSNPAYKDVFNLIKHESI